MLEINWRPTRKELRVFSALLTPFCGVIAALLRYRTGMTTLPMLIFGIGAMIGSIGCIWPRVVRPVYIGWMVAAFPIGWTVSHLVLAAVYFLVFTPLGWLLRMTGHDPLKRRIDRSQVTYWETRPESRKPADYFRQF